MNTNILKIALRQKAIYVPREGRPAKLPHGIGGTTAALVANCASLGFNFSEDALIALNGLTPTDKLKVMETLVEVSGARKNWTPLVKQWDIPTGESYYDHVVTWVANAIGLKEKRGTRLPCGHLIPLNSFPIDRYNGCPFCGTPFRFAELDIPEAAASKLKTLTLWEDQDAKAFMYSLLASPVALDATQVDSLKVLLGLFDLDEKPKVEMKETLMLLVDLLVEQGKDEEAGKLFSSPNDILRYLWYKHTGFLQLIQPKVIAKRKSRNADNYHRQLAEPVKAMLKARKELKLKYTRAECRRYAGWLNGLEMNVDKQAEVMHPRRSMWVRFIRALRLGEYSKRKGFGRLASLMDVFYHQNYEVWQGHVDNYKLKMDHDGSLGMLQERPGLFARSLFSSMLWFGAETTLKYFNEVLDQVPPRLVFTLNMYADTYFDKHASRSAKPLGGTRKRIPPNKLLPLYTENQLQAMRDKVSDLTLESIRLQLAKTLNKNSSIYIDPSLEHVPLSIGDRTEHIQDLPAVPSGTRFPLEGGTVRLFLQWGEGLKAQHLDLDLSCMVAYDSYNERCSYSQLAIPGCKHSGDIQHIPHLKGTAEYIEIDVNTLARRGARYVSFTCNAYTNGSIASNAVVGWMNSQYPMTISSSGVAYHPAHVQHQVRIKQSLDKGLVFGVLDVQKREIIWLELPFHGQIVGDLDLRMVEATLTKLEAKLMLAPLLRLKAETQGLELVTDPAKADEVYDTNWAHQSAEVAKMFLG